MRKSETQRSFKGEEQHMSECTHTSIAYMFFLYILRYAICISQRTYIYINLIKKRNQVQRKKEIEKRLRSVFYIKDC